MTPESTRETTRPRLRSLRLRNPGLTEKIVKLLADGCTVESSAVGRVGRVVEFCEGEFIIQLPRSRGITSFAYGDPLRMEQTEPKAWKIVNIWPGEPGY